MDQALTLEPSAEEIAQAEAEIASIIADIDRIDARIEANQQEIDRMMPITELKLIQLKEAIDALQAAR